MELVAEAVELVRNATHLGDYDQAWNLVTAAAEDRESASERGFAMVSSPDAAERKIGFDLLGCLSHADESLAQRVLAVCLDVLPSETDHSVQAAIARALGCVGDERGVPELLRMVDHPTVEARFYVAWSLPMSVESDAVVEALIRLSADPDDDVRDWATFALGTQCTRDSTAIREALWARIDDQYTEAREEAIAGLARRRDRRVIPYVEWLLERDGIGSLTFEAIACLRDPELVPYLELYDEDEVAEAMRECDPDERAARDAFAAALAEALHRRMPDLDFGMYAEIRQPGLTLSAGESCWSVEHLYERADGDPVAAADLMIADLGSARVGS